MHRFGLPALCAVALCGTALLSAQDSRLPSAPHGQFGGSVTGAYDGWFVDTDQSRAFLVGYFSRNTEQSLDIPIGPNNRIEPGGPDLGQPTHFLPGRHIGMFAVRVPDGFKEQDSLVWTLVANGETTRIPLRLKTDYFVSPFGGATVANEPPVIRLTDHGPAQKGPNARTSTAPALTTSVRARLPLTIWADDDARYSSGTNAPMRNPPPPVAIHWTKYRGPGTVTFNEPDPSLDVFEGGGVGEHFAGKGQTEASFSAPGEYILHAAVNDYSGPGGGGEVCCWTNVMVRVTVTP